MSEMVRSCHAHGLIPIMTDPHQGTLIGIARPSSGRARASTAWAVAGSSDAVGSSSKSIVGSS